MSWLSNCSLNSCCTTSRICFIYIENGIWAPGQAATQQNRAKVTAQTQVSITRDEIVGLLEMFSKLSHIELKHLLGSVQETQKKYKQCWIASTENEECTKQPVYKDSSLVVKGHKHWSRKTHSQSAKTKRKQWQNSTTLGDQR